MTAKNWLAVLMLVVGVPLAAVGLARGNLLMALGGLVLLLVFIYLVLQAIVGATKSGTPIKPAANAAWGMKDQPLESPEAGAASRIKDQDGR